MNCADKLPICIIFFVCRCFPSHRNTAHFQAIKACLTLYHYSTWGAS
jgi:hypothetical protein